MKGAYITVMCLIILSPILYEYYANRVDRGGDDMTMDTVFKKLGTRWHFAYRHSFRSGEGLGTFWF